MMGYDGPIYMTYPTKAICPILLEDYRKITVERKGETNFFTSAVRTEIYANMMGPTVMGLRGCAGPCRPIAVDGLTTARVMISV